MYNFTDTLRNLVKHADKFPSDAARLLDAVRWYEVESHRQYAASASLRLDGASESLRAVLDDYLAALQFTMPDWRKRAVEKAVTLRARFEPLARDRLWLSVDQDFRAVCQIAALARQTDALRNRAYAFAHLHLARLQDWNVLACTVESWAEEAKASIASLDAPRRTQNLPGSSRANQAEMISLAERIASDTAKFSMLLFDLMSYLRERTIGSSRELARLHGNIAVALKKEVGLLQGAGEWRIVDNCEVPPRERLSAEEVRRYTNLLRLSAAEDSVFESAEASMLDDALRLKHIKRLFKESAELAHRAALLADFSKLPAFTSLQRVLERSETC